MTSSKTGHPPPDKDLFAAWLVRAGVVKDLAGVDTAALAALQPQLVDVTRPTSEGLYPEMPHSDADAPGFDGHKVCIIGAGISGLYTALMFDQLGVDYEILEAADRCGGRIYTHHFSDPRDSSKHDYFDIGAERFPETKITWRTFDLFRRWAKVPLLPCSMSSKNQPTRFNDRTVFGYDPNNGFDSEDPESEARGIDPFRVGIANGGTVPLDTLRRPQAVLDDAFDFYRDKVKSDLCKGFDYLIKHDKFSLREYLKSVESLDDESIHWVETLNSATSWVDHAFTEHVLDSLAFDYEKDVKWSCVDGGTSRVVDAIVKLIKNKPQLRRQVLAVTHDKDADDRSKMSVRFRYGTRIETRSYAAVINTTTFGALQKMDLTGLDLPYAAKKAIRSLHYEPSTKIGVKFSRAWWRRDADGLKIKTGGLGKTDMPMRVCIYPSFNVDDPEDEENVLLASYTWGPDSVRISSFVNENSPETQAALKDLVIYNLARLHSDNDADFERLKTIISETWISHRAWDWSKDPHAAGAFALFRPGQFATLYSTLARPACDSRYLIVGEAASASHASIGGALDSAVRGVHLLMTRFQQYGKRQHLLDTFSPTAELDYQTDHLQVALGMLQGKR